MTRICVLENLPQFPIPPSAPLAPFVMPEKNLLIRLRAVFLSFLLLFRLSCSVRLFLFGLFFSATPLIFSPAPYLNLCEARVILARPRKNSPFLPSFCPQLSCKLIPGLHNLFFFPDGFLPTFSIILSPVLSPLLFLSQSETFFISFCSPHPFSPKITQPFFLVSARALFRSP